MNVTSVAVDHGLVFPNESPHGEACPCFGEVEMAEKTVVDDSSLNKSPRLHYSPVLVLWRGHSTVSDNILLLTSGTDSREELVVIGDHALGVDVFQEYPFVTRAIAEAQTSVTGTGHDSGIAF